ncbi:MAG TPA: glycosyltransferase family 4 protein [Microbacteriaceae bacterium]|nr:glycosyltransferase family 4 protein [Microbacteriaceae bacterium]
MSARPRPVLYVHHRPELGGAPQSLRYLIENLDRERFEPHVYCPPGPAADSFASAGAQIHHGEVAAFTHIWASTYGGRRWLLFARELGRAPRHGISFTRLLRRHDFAIVHLNDSPLIGAAALAAHFHIPVVWHLRSALSLDGRLRSSAMRSTIRHLASETIAINDDVARSFGIDSAIIPNAVDLDRFAPRPAEEVRLELGLPQDRPIVSYFGFIYPSKGFRDFIEAARLVKRMGSEALFLVVGGPVRNSEFFETRVGRALTMAGLVSDHQREADELVKRLELQESVRFVPFTQDTARMFQASDIVVAPSRGPELGRPVLEACACGRPVVATGSITGGGILLPDETGVLVPRRSPDALAVALQHLLEQPTERERLGRNARRYAEEHFSAKINAEQVMEIYERLLA